MLIDETSFWKRWIRPVSDVHSRLTERHWLQPLKGRVFFLIAILAALIAVIANSSVRQSQLSVWNENPSFYYLGDLPLFSTTDASYFLANARALKQGETSASIEAKRLYPNRVSRIEEADAETMRDKPLLSVIIAALSPSAERRDILTTAHALIPITAGITALAIVFALGITGYWLEASVAAIGGGLSASYLIRSSAGRIDTDQLNLAFFYFLIGLVVVAARSKSLRLAILFTALAALTGQLFLWWYNHTEFLLAALVALLWLSFVQHLNWRRTVFLGVVFFLLSGVSLQVSAGTSYLTDVFDYGALAFPNTHETITELAIIPLDKVLISAAGHLGVGIFCLVGLILLAIRHPMMAVAYAPLAAFGLLNFLVGNRAVFYSAPILWFGGAWLATTSVRGLFQLVQSDENIFGRVPTVAIVALVSIGTGAAAWLTAPTKYVPRPSFPTEMMSAFQDIGAKVRADEAVIASWWDYGYASLFLNEIPTLHDPGNQNYPVTHLVARSLLETDQRKTVAMLRYLARDGLAGLSQHGTSKAGLYDAMMERSDLPAKDIYLVLTEQMGQWMGSISSLGNWDIDQGRPRQLAGNVSGHVVGYQGLRCEETDKQYLINCNGYEFNLQSGEVNGNPGFGGVAVIRNGQLTGASRFSNGQKTFLQLHYNKVNGGVFLIHDSLYDSSFNQLFHRGQTYEGGFELVYDNYPHARIYKLKGNLGDNR